MNTFLNNVGHALVASSPWWGLFLASLVLALILTPLCRGLARRLGMVDVPSARRINKTPIPRAGGLAVFLSVAICVLGYVCLVGKPLSPVMDNAHFLRLLALGAGLVVVGLLDDKFGLPPLVKLFGQIAVALGAFFWCDISFQHVPFLSELPEWIDCALTVFWIVGAINAFNLIDGLDGLASGLTLIAALGMGGALLFIGYPQSSLVYMILAGACLGFLRYNFNPASVFLGDTGSMFLGFSVAVLPLALKSGDSLFVAVGVPLLTMGVPIFDTSLAIIRRTVRAILKREEKGKDEGNTHVMQADTDHLHHRILRQFVSQKKAAFVLYALAAFFVAIGLGGIALRDRAAGLFVLAFVVAVVIIVRDMRRVELWDAGRLLNTVAHDRTSPLRLRRRLVIPILVAADLLALTAVFFLSALALGKRISGTTVHTGLLLRVVPSFLCLVLAHAYSTVWGRAVISNYLRLIAAILVGTVISVAGYVLFHIPHSNLIAFSCLYSALAILALVALRFVRPILRDTFYLIDASRLRADAKTSRVVVYGAGLRYGMFRRELIRASARTDRTIVGLLDDNPSMRGLHIGGQRVWGALEDAPEVLKRLHADAVVIACELTPERLAEAQRIFASAGVKITLWCCEERTLTA